MTSINGASTNLLFWKPVGAFDTFFNKVVSVLTFGSYCHCEIDFILEKQQWKNMLSSFSLSGGKVKVRAQTVWKRMEDILENIKDDTKIHLVFFTLWGSELNVRMLTASDSYIFNRLPDPRYTTSVPFQMSPDEVRLSLGFCLQELHKKYDNKAAAMLFIPRVESICPRNFSNLPNKYFCSEFCMYLLQQCRPELRIYYPENISPNELYKIIKDHNGTLLSDEFVSS